VCRGTDSAFRIGGDEFALILSGASRDEAAQVATRAQAAIDRLDGSAGVSCGVAGIPEDGDTDDRLIAAADAAMYRLKGHPRAMVPPDHDPARRRLAVASRLAAQLTMLGDVDSIASAVVDELHRAFGYYLTVVHRLEDHGVLRIVAGAGPLAVSDDTRCDPDYLGRDTHDDPGSELSVPIHVGDRLWGVLNLEQIATYAFNDDDVLLAESVVAQMVGGIHRCELVEKLEGLFATTVTILCDALETRDANTARHTSDVADRALILGRRLAIDPGRMRALGYCARLHDIGTIGVRTELLSKPAALTRAEYIEIQAHSEIGAELLARAPLPNSPAAPARNSIRRCRGVPRNLSGVRADAGSARGPAHQPYRWSGGQAQPPGDTKPMAAVVADVLFLPGLQVGGETLPVAQLEAGCKQRRADASALAGGIDAKHAEIQVAVVRVVALHRAQSPAHERRSPSHAETGQACEPRHLPGGHLPAVGEHPQGRAGEVLGRPAHVLLGTPPQRPAEELAAVPRARARIGEHPALDRVVVKRPREHARQLFVIAELDRPGRHRGGILDG
jgi:hypothetical protein